MNVNHRVGGLEVGVTNREQAWRVNHRAGGLEDARPLSGKRLQKISPRRKPATGTTFPFPRATSIKLHRSFGATLLPGCQTCLPARVLPDSRRIFQLTGKRIVKGPLSVFICGRIDEFSLVGTIIPFCSGIAAIPCLPAEIKSSLRGAPNRIAGALTGGRQMRFFSGNSRFPAGTEAPSDLAVHSVLEAHRRDCPKIPFSTLLKKPAMKSLLSIAPLVFLAGSMRKSALADFTCAAF
ncbi:hypothetical protein OFAG_01175 [Oxalobacter formigenes HOxBLS]|uniref:Uncharacterized protein n=1 Tax=Oxalobacter paraformigenes TaxID=556268 RepID=C3X486_9BURK|nr:hypothetical protein OFAG_01175 [Oxalobacter paraformigenes]